MRQRPQEPRVRGRVGRGGFSRGRVGAAPQGAGGGSPALSTTLRLGHLGPP